MKNWFVLNTKPKKEFHVEKIFSECGFDIYTPKYRQENHTKPFFPGYAFLHFDFPDQYQIVRYTRGVKRVVGNREGPIPIPGSVIQKIRERERDGLIELEKFGISPEIGDEIEIMEGPLKGLRGIFKKELTDKQRVVILMSYISYQGKLIIEKKKIKKAL